MSWLTKLYCFLGCFFALSMGHALGSDRGALKSVVLDPAKFHHIKFENTPPTAYLRQGQFLAAEVDGSSSALVQSFSEPLQIQSAEIKWSLSGIVKTRNASHETQKQGDDFPLRVGLLVEGEAPWLGFLAPSWMKLVKSIMKIPANKMLYLVAGAKHEANLYWESPYSASMSNFSGQTIASAKDGDYTTSFRLKKPLAVVGLWLMADGDNTGSKFKILLKHLKLAP